MNLEQEILNELVSIKTLIMKQEQKRPLGWDFEHTERTIEELEQLETKGSQLVPIRLERQMELQNRERKWRLAKSTLKEILDDLGYPDVPIDERERALYIKILVLWEGI